MKPRVTLRKALEDPELLGSALAGPTWHAWRSLLLAAMGEPLNPDVLKTFTRFTGRTVPPPQRVDELWCCVGRRGGKSRAMIPRSWSLKVLRATSIPNCHSRLLTRRWIVTRQPRAPNTWRSSEPTLRASSCVRRWTLASIWAISIETSCLSSTAAPSIYLNTRDL